MLITRDREKKAISARDVFYNTLLTTKIIYFVKLLKYEMDLIIVFLSFAMANIYIYIYGTFNSESK